MLLTEITPSREISTDLDVNLTPLEPEPLYGLQVDVIDKVVPDNIWVGESDLHLSVISGFDQGWREYLLAVNLRLDKTRFNDSLALFLKEVKGMIWPTTTVYGEEIVILGPDEDNYPYPFKKDQPEGNLLALKVDSRFDPSGDVKRLLQQRSEVLSAFESLLEEFGVSDPEQFIKDDQVLGRQINNNLYVTLAGIGNHYPEPIKLPRRVAVTFINTAGQQRVISREPADLTLV